MRINENFTEEWMYHMRVLVIGSGAREHAMADKLIESTSVTSVHSCPGNILMETIGPVYDIEICDFDKISKICLNHNIDLIAVGPEIPMAAGISEYFETSSIKVFGPTSGAARLESSKAFTRELLERIDVPSPNFNIFDDINKAIDWIDRNDGPKVIKADGLAAGKGVIIADRKEAQKIAVNAIMGDKIFGESGNNLIIEEKLEGPEISVFAFCDAENISNPVVACDYKRAQDGDRGLNTGGMGSYSYPGIIDNSLLQHIKDIILLPTVSEMTRLGVPYKGVLYAGLMITPSGPKVLEFNCRFGDPEAQVILPRLKTDLGSVMDACVTGNLRSVVVEWNDLACVGVVLASAGYPSAYQTGYEISNLNESVENTKLFAGGISINSTTGINCTNGGRILTAVGMADTISKARKLAYEKLNTINSSNTFFRTDIGQVLRT